MKKNTTKKGINDVKVKKSCKKEKSMKWIKMHKMIYKQIDLWDLNDKKSIKLYKKWKSTMI